MKTHRLLSLWLAFSVTCFALLHPSPLQATTGGHKYRDPTGWAIIQRIMLGMFGMTHDDDPDCVDPVTSVNAAAFMQEYGHELPALLAPDARYVACRPAIAHVTSSAYTLIARQPGNTNALCTAVRFQHNLLGWIESLTFDRPLTLADGATYPAGTPVPIEPLMRALALRRIALPPGTPTLVIKRAVQKTSYANRDVTKTTVSSLLRGSVPTTRSSFDGVTRFYVTPLPVLTTGEFIHTIERKYAGTKPGKHPKYTHLFVYANATDKTPPFGLFLATLRKGNLDFIYKFKLDNRDKSLIATPDFEALRAFMATNPPIRGLAFARFYFAINTTAHSASNVPMLGRSTRGSSALGNIKPRPEK